MESFLCSSEPSQEIAQPGSERGIWFALEVHFVVVGVGVGRRGEEDVIAAAIFLMV